MKVLCVDGQRREEDIGSEPLLQEGEVYEVEREVWGLLRNGRTAFCYKLKDVNLPHVYTVNRFIPCSDDAVSSTQELIPQNTGLEIKLITEKTEV